MKRGRGGEEGAGRKGEVPKAKVAQYVLKHILVLQFLRSEVFVTVYNR